MEDLLKTYLSNISEWNTWTAQQRAEAHAMGGGGTFDLDEFQRIVALLDNPVGSIPINTDTQILVADALGATREQLEQAVWPYLFDCDGDIETNFRALEDINELVRLISRLRGFAVGPDAACNEVLGAARNRWEELHSGTAEWLEMSFSGDGDDEEDQTYNAGLKEEFMGLTFKAS